MKFCFLNGRYLPAKDATISPQDRGFLFGEGLFETWRTYRGRPFALNEHLRRMQRSARELGIPFNADEPWDRRSRELAKRNGFTEGGAALRLTITRGPGAWSLIPEDSVTPTRYLAIRALDPDLERIRHDGVSIHTTRFGSGVNLELRRIKSLNYLPAIIGRKEALRRGCFESVYHLEDGSLLEGTTSNLFLVKDGRLFTPALGEGILPGVTRALVLKLARKLGPVEEGHVTLTDLAEADEAFLTSTSIEVVPVLKAGRRRVGKGRPGELTRALQDKYRAYVSREVGIPIDQLGA